MVNPPKKVVSVLDQLADALGFRATILPRWGELTILITMAAVRGMRFSPRLLRAWTCQGSRDNWRYR